MTSAVTCTPIIFDEKKNTKFFKMIKTLKGLGETLHKARLTFDTYMRPTSPGIGQPDSYVRPKSERHCQINSHLKPPSTGLG